MTIPRQLLITGILCALLAGFIVYQAQNMRFERDISYQKAAFDHQHNAITTKAQQDTADALHRTNAAQDAAAALDQQNSEKLANAQAENDRLRADVAAGTRRVRIAAANLATCQHTASRGASTSGVGDAAEIELAPAVGSNILDIRAGIISDQAKLDYLQGYVRDVVKQCKR